MRVNDKEDDEGGFVETCGEVWGEMPRRGGLKGEGTLVCGVNGSKGKDGEGDDMDEVKEGRVGRADGAEAEVETETDA